MFLTALTLWRAQMNVSFQRGSRFARQRARQLVIGIPRRLQAAVRIELL